MDFLFGFLCFVLVVSILARLFKKLIIWSIIVFPLVLILNAIGIIDMYGSSTAFKADSLAQVERFERGDTYPVGMFLNFHMAPDPCDFPLNVKEYSSCPEYWSTGIELLKSDFLKYDYVAIKVGWPYTIEGDLEAIQEVVAIAKPRGIPLLVEVAYTESESCGIEGLETGFFRYKKFMFMKNFEKHDFDYKKIYPYEEDHFGSNPDGPKEAMIAAGLIKR